MADADAGWPLRGTVAWLTAEQGGRSTGPPDLAPDRDYATTAFVPPEPADRGLRSILLRGFDPRASTSPAEARWLDRDGAPSVAPGTVVVVTEGLRTVAYFHVAEVLPD
jgi:hypothetical protein